MNKREKAEKAVTDALFSVGQRANGEVNISAEKREEIVELCLIWQELNRKDELEAMAFLTIVAGLTNAERQGT